MLDLYDEFKAFFNKYTEPEPEPEEFRFVNTRTFGSIIEQESYGPQPEYRRSAARGRGTFRGSFRGRGRGYYPVPR